jgi:hypothetical protein
MTRDEAITALGALGNTPDDVAETLRVLGIKAWKCNYRCCPLARVINGYVWGIGFAYTYGEESFELTQACKDFLWRFDSGVAYQDLVAPQRALLQYA